VGIPREEMASIFDLLRCSGVEEFQFRRDGSILQPVVHEWLQKDTLANWRRITGGADAGACLQHESAAVQFG